MNVYGYMSDCVCVYGCVCVSVVYVANGMGVCESAVYVANVCEYVSMCMMREWITWDRT